MDHSVSDNLVENVDLHLARLSLQRRTDELWSTLDAAQFAVMLVHEDIDSDAEHEALSNFETVFAALVRAWDEDSVGNKKPLLEAVGNRVDSLADVGLFVHWGSMLGALNRSNQAQVTMPMAVLFIDRRDTADITVTVPITIPADQPPFNLEDDLTQ